MSPNARFSPASVAIVLAAGASLFLLAARQADPQAATETHFLAIWSTAVLLCAAGLAARPSLDLAGSTLLLVLAGWVVPAGPVRGATFGALLIAGLGLALHRHLTDGTEGLEWSLMVPAALGAQLLARSDRLLTGLLEPRTLFGLVVLPLIAAWALGWIGRNRSVGTALLTAGACLVLAPGWSVAVVLSLLGVVLGTISPIGATSRWIRLAGLVALVVAAGAWHPSLPVVVLLSTLLIAAPQGWKGAITVAIGAVIAMALLPGVRGWEEALLRAALLLVLLPAAVFVGTTRLPSVAAALFVAVLAARTVPLPGALAAPLAVAALAFPAKGAFVALQRVWTAVLLSGTLLLAAYPWLRPDSLRDTLHIFGIGGDWASVAGVVVGFLVIGWCVERAQIGRPGPLLPAGAALVVLGLAALLNLPAPSTYTLAETPLVLSAEHGKIARGLQPAPEVSSVVLDSYLQNSVPLPAGTPVAEVALTTESGDDLRWLIRVGIESGEWAARREDVATADGFQAPSPWMTWLPAGSEAFAQRYRARWDTPTTVTATRLVITRRPELPSNVGIAVLHLELRP